MILVGEVLRAHVTMVQSDPLKLELLNYHDEWPLEQHPFWQAVLNHTLTYEQVIRGEIQHYLRTRSGQKVRETALVDSKGKDHKGAVFSSLLKIYLEECTADKTGPSHLDLIRRLVVDGGTSQSHLAEARPTPGNAAAIALYQDIATRGPGCHLIGAGAVEYFYCRLSPKIYEAYTGFYGMTESQAETYRVHGTLDHEHAENSFLALESVRNTQGLEAVRLSVRDAFVATSLHYDGMLQAAMGVKKYWSGK